MCRRDYLRSYRLGHPTEPWIIWDELNAPKICEWPDCEEKAYGHGLCVRDYTRAKRLDFPDEPWTAWELSQPKPRTDGLKECSKCHEDRPLDMFYNESARPDGKNNYCIPCSQIVSRQWREANPDLKAEYDRRYYKEKPWVKIAIEQSRRAMQNDVIDEKVKVPVLRERDGDHCYFCGVLMDFETRKRGGNKATHEHLVAVKRGGHNTYENSVLACDRCNSSKGMKSVEEFMAFRTLIQSVA